MYSFNGAISSIFQNLLIKRKVDEQWLLKLSDEHLFLYISIVCSRVVLVVMKAIMLMVFVK